MVRLAHLADHPEVITSLAQWLHGEWGHLPDASLEKRVAQLEAQAQRGTLPCAFVAFDDSELVGSASLVPNDMHSHPELTPWLAAVYVVPSARGRGIGSALSLRVAQETMALGHAQLYLFTPSQQRLYARLGWREFATELYNTRQVSVMVCDLPPNPSLQRTTQAHSRLCGR